MFENFTHTQTLDSKEEKKQEKHSIHFSSAIKKALIQPDESSAFSQMAKQSGLVLEGGGMRGLFTAGVLDCFMDAQIHFPYIVAVSAGACNGLSYMSQQRGRSRFSCVEVLKKFHYIGIQHLPGYKSLLNLDFMFDQLPNEVLPFDYDTYFDNPTRFEMVVTNCDTGKSEYLCEKHSRQRLLDIVKASSSLPYACPIVKLDRKKYLDGGISDSIPIQHARERGFSYNVVVCTHERGYRSSAKDFKIPNFVYTKFPRLRVLLSHRHKNYNTQLELIEHLEDKGEIIVIRPSKPVKVKILDSNTLRLNALYNHGYHQAMQIIASYPNKKQS